KEFPTDRFAHRKELCPNVDENLVKRKDENVETAFEILCIVRADYMSEGLINEFDRYSYYERLTFSENVVRGLGKFTFMDVFLPFFVGILDKETDSAVWDNLVKAIKLFLECQPTQGTSN
ncbi:hypothetical protein PMAYCL1PPCAC_17560, partial [Pristionchus mayeri]